MIECYTWKTSNGRKATIMLEECGLEYEVHPIHIGKGEQFKPEFLAISPNNRIPALVDPDAEGGTLAVFESGAILLYLAEKTGKLIPSDQCKRWQVVQWVMFQMAGIGPMQGQAVVFVRYFPEDVPPARERYINETRRLYSVLDTRLAGREWIVDDFSVADIANWSWARIHEWSGVSVEGLDNLNRWLQAMNNRPAVSRGVDVPVKSERTLDDEEKVKKASESARKMLQL